MEVQAHEPSSSASSSTVSTNYEVFLSCSGKSTCTTFISRLYRELVNAGIRTFMDDEESKKGEEIGPNLLRAITESRIFIPIFSTSYASSKWCLDKLVQIMEFRDTMGQTVLPIFYHVNPRDVRNQIEGFGQQFHRLANCSDKGAVERWEKALRDAGELKGLDLKDVENGNESRLIQKVLRSVWSELSQSFFDVAENLVGIDSCVRLLTLLNGESKDVRFVGIWGMGGIGKTTIAEAVFGRIRQNFEGSIFLEDVREASKQPDGLVCLQQTLLSDVLKQEIQFIRNVDEGISLIKKCLHSKKVIIFLDDVDKIEQLKTLAGGSDWFGPGSRIVITTRDKRVLLDHNVDKIYEPKELDFDQSLQLLCKHAFGKDQPPDDFMKLAKDVVLTIGGLPLGLKVLGSFLSDKSSTTVWKSTLHRLRKIPHKDVQEKLKISYDELEDSDKEIFLDIACFFIGMDKEYAIDICEGCYFLASSGIINLIQKSLVKIDNYNKLRMHDQLRDMGRHIVRQEDPNEPGKRSRLWSHEEVLNVLEKREGTRNVEGIICKLEGEEAALEEIHVRTEAFEMMPQLRLLEIDNAHLEGDFKKLPSELRWLSWKGCPLQSITDFHLEKLAVLDLSYSRIRRFLTDLNRDKQFPGLKVLDLSYCRYLIKTPNFLGLPNLEKLNLEGCIKLEALPRSICNLISLKKLILSGCSNLTKLPDLHGSLNQLEVLKFEDCKLLCRLPDLIGSMRNLKSLSLDGTTITELPEAIGSLEKIEVLTIRHCKKLIKLPDSMGRMKLLKRFEIDETGIVKFPEDFGNLSSLEVLTMHGCLKFRGFPEIFGSLSVSFSGLGSLTSLDVSDCNLSERGIPSDFGNLYSLKKLSLSFNNFGRLPDSIGALSRLQSLEIVNCRILQSLPELPSSLCSLDLNNCTSMERLPDLSNLRKLHRLDLRNCTELAEIQGMKKMESLQELWMSGCSRYLVDSMKKSLGQLVLQRLSLCSFPGSKIPFWFTPTVTKAIVWSNREHEIQLECEIPTRLWNPEKHHKIVSLVLCFVFTNQSEILEISPMTLKVQVKRNGGHIYSNSGHPLVIFSKRHQDQICLYQFRDWFDNFVTELEEGDEISFTIQAGLETEVKKGGMYVVYEDRSRWNFFTSSDDDDDDDDDDDSDDGGVVIGGHVAGGRAGRKRRKRQLLDDDVDDNF